MRLPWHRPLCTHRITRPNHKRVVVFCPMDVDELEKPDSIAKVDVAVAQGPEAEKVHGVVTGESESVSGAEVWQKSEGLLTRFPSLSPAPFLAQGVVSHCDHRQTSQPAYPAHLHRTEQ